MIFSRFMRLYFVTMVEEVTEMKNCQMSLAVISFQL